MRPIYLDYNATTPIAPEVLHEMLPFLTQEFGNPSSGHGYGEVARQAVFLARKRVANLLGCSPDEIVFTSGGTEADNLAIKGIAYANTDRGNHIITTQTEHPAVLETCKDLEKRGFQVTYLPVDQYGLVSPKAIEESINPHTILITVMHANNEVGTLQPLSEIGEIARRHGVYFHTDAAQSVGKVVTNVDELKVDLLTVAAHKFYGPKGIGALFIRRGTAIEQVLHGASQEFGFRAGTENVAGIVGLGKACHLALLELNDRISELTRLSKMFFDLLKERLQGIHLNGHPEQRLPNTVNISFNDIHGGQLLALMPEIAASTGSACHHGAEFVSPVLAAMGIPEGRAFGAVRFSLGRGIDEENILKAVDLIVTNVQRLRHQA